MTDETKASPIPWPEPSDDGSGDKTHLMVQEAKSATAAEASLRSVRVGVEGYNSFVNHREPEVPAAQYDQIAEVLNRVGNMVIEELKALPMPPEFAEHDEPDALYTPYLSHAVFMLLGVLAAKELPDGTHADRYAWASAFVRSWASFGIYKAAQKAGLSQDDTSRVAASVSVMQPVDFGMIASIHRARAEVIEQAKSRGIEPQALMQEKLQEVLRGKGSKGPLPGEPGDDEMAF